MIIRERNKVTKNPENVYDITGLFVSINSFLQADNLTTVQWHTISFGEARLTKVHLLDKDDGTDGFLTMCGSNGGPHFVYAKENQIILTNANHCKKCLKSLFAHYNIVH